jgi:hypothetical protein
MNQHRSFRRSEIRLLCPCRMLDGAPLELELLDVSPRGCLARSRGFPLYVGQSLRMFPEGCEEFTATVRRSEADIVGIEFDGELPSLVLERVRCYTPLPSQSDFEAHTDGAAPPPAELPVAEPVSEPTKAAAPYGSLLTAGKDKPRRKKMALF